MSDRQFEVSFAGVTNENRSGIRTNFQADLQGYEQIDPYTGQDGLDWQKYDSMVVACDEQTCTLDAATGTIRAIDLYAHAGHDGQMDGSLALTHGAADGFTVDPTRGLHLPWPGLYKIEIQVAVTSSYAADAGGTPGKGFVISYGDAIQVPAAQSPLLSADTTSWTSPVMATYLDATVAGGPWYLKIRFFGGAAYPSDGGTYTIAMNTAATYLKATWMSPASDQIITPYYVVPT